MLKRTAPYMKAGFQDNLLFLGFGSIISSIDAPELQEIYINLLSYWAEDRSVEDTFQYLASKGYSHNLIDKAIKDAIEKKYIIDTKFYNRDNPFSRNHLFYTFLGNNPHIIQERLSRKHVLILGCGGIGNLISASLATSGIKKLTLVDDDKIELSNLNRQFMFKRSDVGHHKTLTLKRELLERVENIDIDTYEARVSLEILDQIGKVDLIVLSADSGDCLPLINRYCVKNKIPYLNICYVQDIAVWGPFYIPGRTGCYYCQNILATSDHANNELSQMIETINNSYQPPSNAGVNMLAASLGYLDILRFLGEFGEIHSTNNRVGLWTHNLTFEKQDCKPNQNCKTCSAY